MHMQKAPASHHKPCPPSPPPLAPESNPARPGAQRFPQGAVQPIDQPIDLTAVALENAMESFVAIEPPAQGTVHIVGALPNVSRCLRGLSDLPQDGGCFHKGLRI